MSNNSQINKYEQFLEFCEKGKTSSCMEIIKSGLNLNDMYDDEIQLIDLAITKVLLAYYHNSDRAFKSGKLRRCLDYLLKQKVDYSKCYMSFFTATCVTSNYKCADKLLDNGFDVNQKYKGYSSYYDNVLETAIEMYGMYNHKKRKKKINKIRMQKIKYLLSIENVDFSKCEISTSLMKKYNHTELLELINIDELNKKMN